MIRIAAIAAMSAVAFTAGAVGASAYGGETFVCEDGSTLTVRAGDLDVLKRTNACVAAHFGLKVSAARGSGVPLPVRRPLGSISGERMAEDIAAMPREVAAPRPKPMTTGSIAGGEAPEEIGTFRRVRILNPSPGGSDVFLHTR